MLYRLAQHVQLVERDGGSFLMARSPLCALRLNPALAAMVRRGLTGAIAPASDAEAAVLEQLASKGFVVRERSATAQPASLPTVSVVIPVKDRADELARCLDSISRVDYPRELLQVIVVDDGSSDDSAAVARERGALVVPSTAAHGAAVAFEAG